MAIFHAYQLWSDHSTSLPSSLHSSYSPTDRVKVALRRESTVQWHEVESSFVDSEYREVRDRQMKELEMEDDILTKLPVRYVLLPSLCFLKNLTERRVGIYVRIYIKSRMNS